MNFVQLFAIWNAEVTPPRKAIQEPCKEMESDVTI